MFDDRWVYPDPDRNDEAGKKLAILKGAARAADMTDDMFKAKFLVIIPSIAAASLHVLESEATARPNCSSLVCGEKVRRQLLRHASNMHDGANRCCTGAQYPPAGDVLTEIVAAGQSFAGAAGLRHLRCVREAMLP